MACQTSPLKPEKCPYFTFSWSLRQVDLLINRLEACGRQIIMCATQWINKPSMFLQYITVRTATWEHSELGVRPCPGAARVIGQTAVRGRVRRLDAADLQQARRQCCQAGLRVQGQWEVLPVFLPADHRRRVARDLTAQQGSVTKVRGDRLGGDDHL